MMTHFLATPTSSSFPYVGILIGLPALGAIVLSLLPRASTSAIRWTALGVSLMTLVIAVVMAFRFHVGNGGYQFYTNHSWATSLGVSWATGVDGISIFMVVLTTLLIPLALLGAGEKRRTKAFTAWLLLLEAACIGSFVSLDLILFFFFFELTLIPSYFLIAGWGGPARAAAAVKFFLYTFFGSAIMLVGILYMAFTHEAQTHILTFSVIALQGTKFSGVAGVLLFCAFTIGFAIKAPMFPFHTWSPDTYSESPIGAVIILSGVLAKLGTYGIIRFDLGILGHASRVMAPVMLTLAVIGMLYGALVACAQRDLKRIIAYSSLAQMGFIVLGIFSFSSLGLTGSVLLMVNHGIITAAFFLLIGWIVKRRGTSNAGELVGLQGPAPVLAAIFTVVMLASIGLPGLNGFISEYLVLIGTFITHRWWAVVGVSAVVFAALYLLWAYQRVFHGKAEGANAATKDLTWGERAVIAPLLLLIVVLGIFPSPILHRIEPSVNRTLTQVAIHGCVSRTPLPGSSCGGSK
jgi:NADH-quinone oxidoreductase subunit M